MYAPDLVKYKNKFYIYFPANGTNYVVTADSINGKWSEPVDLKIGNIDPGHITDEQGKGIYFSATVGLCHCLTMVFQLPETLRVHTMAGPYLKTGPSNAFAWRARS